MLSNKHISNSQFQFSAQPWTPNTKFASNFQFEQGKSYIIEKKNDKYQKEVQSGCKPSFNNFPTNVCGNELEKASSVEGTAFTCDYGNQMSAIKLKSCVLTSSQSITQEQVNYDEVLSQGETINSTEFVGDQTFRKYEEEDFGAFSSRRGSFSVISVSEITQQDELESLKGYNERQNKNFIPQSALNSFGGSQQTSFKLNAAPFVQKSKLGAEEKKENKLGFSAMMNKISAETLNNEFTPSTPYVHKFRTEICKNFELTGFCKFGDECSFAHGRRHMMVKTDVSVLFKTKLCKKYSTNGYCPYGIRCQFIHDISEASPEVKVQIEQLMEGNKFFNKNKNEKKDQPKDSSVFLSSATKVAPWVPKSQAIQTISDNQTKIVQENLKIIPQVIEVNPQAQPESAKLQIIRAAHEATEVLPVSQPPQTRIGGFGNKATAHAFEIEKLDFSEIVVHNINVSIQELQKKSKMYQKKVGNKRHLQIPQPSIQYINIYSHNIPRLKVFEEMTTEREQMWLAHRAYHEGYEDDEEASLEFQQHQAELQGGFFFGDAASYEQHLEKAIKEAEQRQIVKEEEPMEQEELICNMLMDTFNYFSYLSEQAVLQ